MKRSLVHLLAAVLVASAVALVAGAAPAQALTSCSVMAPCLPQNAGFATNLPEDQVALFEGNVLASGVVLAFNSAGGSASPTSAVEGDYIGDGRGSGTSGFVTDDNTAADSAGVFGRHNSATPGERAAGVRGESQATGSAGIGVLGLHAGAGLGVAGFTPTGTGVAGVSGNIGVLGVETQAAGVAGAFAGDVVVTGTLTKGAGAFRIDHPLDPQRKYLQHSFVESPDMKNVYDGVVRTDRRGFATVRLPRYFQALNRSFRYQLTPLGKAAWDARAGIWQEIRDNRFVIRSEPRTKISWQVTGIRKDRYANAHRIPVEIDKTAAPAQPAALRTLAQQFAP